MISSHPLSWPAGWKRCEWRKRAAFGKTTAGQYGSHKGELSVTDGTARILYELGRLGIGRDDIVISTNVKLRLDGLPRSDGPAPTDPGVAVYWTEKQGATRCMAIDRYDRVADNLAAVAATIEAMRAIERHGGAEILNRAFTGFTALPDLTKATRTWREVLEFRPDDRITGADVLNRYRRLAVHRHPDRGGSDAAMSELNAARDQAQQELQ